MHRFSLAAFASQGDRRRWLALAVVCLAQLMIVLDTTIVNVALPAIQRDLHFDQGNLTWVINAFLVTFGSVLLLAGRLGDLFGRRRVFLAGVIVFTGASILCGLAPRQGALIGARLIQGVGAAMQASVILAIIATEFPRPSDRARAMSAYVFVAVAGGSMGLLLGGALTQALSWHWIFFVNLPIGAMTIVLGQALISTDVREGTRGRIDWVGSLLVTASLMSAIYAIVQASGHGWASSSVLGFGGLSAALMAAFLAVEARIENPIMPLRVLRLRGLVSSSVVRGFLVTGMLATPPRHLYRRAPGLTEANEETRVRATGEARRSVWRRDHRSRSVITAPPDAARATGSRARAPQPSRQLAVPAPRPDDASLRSSTEFVAALLGRAERSGSRFPGSKAPAQR
ncbi:MAG: MFS transporter [Solirubrobacteraceae bacterium]